MDHMIPSDHNDEAARPSWPPDYAYPTGIIAPRIARALRRRGIAATQDEVETVALRLIEAEDDPFDRWQRVTCIRVRNGRHCHGPENGGCSPCCDIPF